ncbi:MAG: hypothetical protein U1C33_07520, partial [Candidatus Cloacimonadaceae bacterium]|nr:hypothetical protein [Candidatus Cloacimonadaceae bacterium]
MIERVSNSPKILMVNSSRGFIGGVERLMIQLCQSLKEKDWQVYGLFERSAYEDPEFDRVFDDFEVSDKTDISDFISYYQEIGIDIVCIHKSDKWQWVKTLQSHFQTVTIVHDHDYYCLRRHKYFPIKRKNCYLPYSNLY